MFFYFLYKSVFADANLFSHAGCNSVILRTSTDPVAEQLLKTWIDYEPNCGGTQFLSFSE
jgi:hypothetical protein